MDKKEQDDWRELVVVLRKERDEVRSLHGQAVESLAWTRAELGRALSESGRLRTELDRARADVSRAESRTVEVCGDAERWRLEVLRKREDVAEARKQSERDAIELARLRDVLGKQASEIETLSGECFTLRSEAKARQWCLKSLEVGPGGLVTLLGVPVRRALANDEVAKIKQLEEESTRHTLVVGPRTPRPWVDCPICKSRWPHGNPCQNAACPESCWSAEPKETIEHPKSSLRCGHCAKPLTAKDAGPRPESRPWEEHQTCYDRPKHEGKCPTCGADRGTAEACAPTCAALAVRLKACHFAGYVECPRCGYLSPPGDSCLLCGTRPIIRSVYQVNGMPRSPHPPEDIDASDGVAP